MEGNGWGEWKNLVLHQLEDQGDAIKAIERAVVRIEKDLVALKVRAGVWGAIAGSLAVLVGLLTKLF